MSRNDLYSLRRPSRFELTEQQYLIGRNKEAQFFLEQLAANVPSGRVINLYGTGGVGKSYLLNEFHRLSLMADIKFLILDCRDLPRNRTDFCMYLLHTLGYPTHQIQDALNEMTLIQICSDVLLEFAEDKKMVLALDTFEVIGEIEDWLREEFLIHLEPDILFVVSGRFPLQGAWLFSPVWRHHIYRLPITELNYDEVKQYLELSGIHSGDMAQQIWAKTKGHPLTMALLVSTTLAQTLHQTTFADHNEVFKHVVSVWLKEVPNPDIRELVETASVLRQFNQELLSYVLEKTVTTEQFQQLVAHSFIQRVDQGWLLHDLLRDAISFELRLRMPVHYDNIWNRCIRYYCNKMKQSSRKKLASWDNAEFLYYIGNQLVQFLIYRQSICYSVENLNSSNWSEAEQYIEQRRLTAKDAYIQFTNRETNEQVEYVLSMESSLNVLKQINLKELYELDPTCVKLIRSEQGAICGIMEIIPINEHTMAFLKSKPLSSTYFNHLSNITLKELMVPANSKSGYFVRTLDVYDFSDISMMQASLLTLITHIMSAGYIVAAPTPAPISYAICTSIGLDIVKDIFHFDYDGRTPTPYYFMDTRGNKVHDYLNKMIASFGIQEKVKDEEANIPSLTRREIEIVERLTLGYSNKELAAEFCLSEPTVKKHLTNIFKKLEVKNRTQLVNTYKRLSK